MATNLSRHQPQIRTLAIIPENTARTYQEQIGTADGIILTLHHDAEALDRALEQDANGFDVVILDNGAVDAYATVARLRERSLQCLVILVDEDADFGMPGQADDISVEPFHDGDLLKRIQRLAEQRRLETLRADALPPVRAFAKLLHKAGTGREKQQAAVQTIADLGYDFVAFYTTTQANPPALKLTASTSQPEPPHDAPTGDAAPANSVLLQVAASGQSRIIGPDETLQHPLINQQQYQSGACVPVGHTLRFGVILACREAPDAITQHNVLMLELVGAQLANALARQDQL